MAGDSGPSIPDTDNWSEWTFEQALLALTGEKGDLHTPAQATLFTFNASPSSNDWASYHAWGDYYYGVNLNNDAIDAWNHAFTAIDEMMPDVARGKRGSMDLQTLRDLEMQIKLFAVWSDGTGDGINSWARALDSDDSSFRGKAASLIQWRLKANGDGLVDTHEQLTTRHGRPIADAVKDAGDELQTWTTTMSSAWTNATSQGLKFLLWNKVADEINAIHQYIVDSGLQLGTPNYRLNAFGPFVDLGKKYIKDALSHYPKGDLTAASTWQSIGTSINESVVAQLKSLLDVPAQGAMGSLAPKYILATSALVEITAPPKETPPTPDPGGNNDIPPPPDGSGNPPPPPPGGSGNVPPPPGGDGGGGGNDIPPPGGDGGGNGDLNIPGGGDGGGNGNVPGGGGDLPPPGDGSAGINGLGVPGGGDGGGGPGTDGPPGGADPAGGGGAFLPFAPPGGAGTNGNGPGGNGSIGPGGDGAFEEPGGGDGVIGAPPGGDGGGNGSLLPPGAGDSRTVTPPGGGADGKGGGAGAGGGFGADPGKGFDAGGGVGAGAGAGGGGLGLGSGPGGLGGAGGLGAGRDGLGGLGGGLGGGPGSGVGLGGGSGAGSGGGLFGGVPSQLTGGSPGANGAPGTSGGAGGVPFFPPMMGGQGAGGEKPQERERQTWLSEDEEIWGTSVSVGSGVIGRLEEEEHETEEVPLSRPSRQRRADGPRRPRPAERAAETNEEGEETSGSASAT